VRKRGLSFTAVRNLTSASTLSNFSALDVAQVNWCDKPKNVDLHRLKAMERHLAEHQQRTEPVYMC